MVRPAKERGQRVKHHLKDWREFLGITQERAMERLGWSQSKISRIENFRLPLYIDDLHAAADAYGRTPWELMNVDPNKEREFIDASEMWPSASPEQRKQIADYTRFIIDQGKKAG